MFGNKREHIKLYDRTIPVELFLKWNIQYETVLTLRIILYALETVHTEFYSQSIIPREFFELLFAIIYKMLLIYSHKHSLYNDL